MHELTDLSTAPSRVAEPIAVVGMSCRLPGAADLGAYWRLLSEGRDAVTEAPHDRWPEGSAAGYRRAGFIDEVDAFDAGFFDISPFEAAAMDPQQRVVLELAWQALEHARIVPANCEGTSTGVFVGVIADDYATLSSRRDGDGGPYTFTGTQRSFIADRVSQLLNARGPSATVDSGQSSSLVAVHLACASLREGRTEMALAGGVNLNLSPERTDAIGRFGALSPDGRCYTFDSRANGYVRGEGGALIVLKRLSDAIAAGDRVHCVILGSAMNNGTGEGLTVPDRDAQEAVIREACAGAGIARETVQYVELHGTGTPVGDPVEAAALGAVLGVGRGADERLLVGSVKTNIGHLEGAAGIAGLLKVALSLGHREIPPSLNHATTHPDIPLDELGLAMATEHVRQWPAPERRLVAGVSSFSMGGGNCHMVLAEPPAPLAKSTALPAGGICPPWVLTARSTSALQGQAGALLRHLDPHSAAHPTADPVDIAASLALSRAQFEHRAVLLDPDPAARLATLQALAAGESDSAAVTGAVVAGGTAFLFPGQGTEWPEMARDLFESSPVFAARLTECAEALAPFVDFEVVDVLQEGSALDRVEVVQPVLWAVMVSLFAVWRSHGVKPDVVIGHSQGEIAAATVIGALSLSDAARVVAVRSRAIARLTDRGGGMLSVNAPGDVLEAVLATSPKSVSVAVLASSRSTVLTGSVEALEVVRLAIRDAGHRAKLLPIGYASHSSVVEELREEILAELSPIRPVSTETPLLSTVTGALFDTVGMDAEYWYRNLRQPVEFARAVQAAFDRDCGLFIECGPHPVLLDGVEECAEDSGRRVAVVGTLRRDDGSTRRIQRELATAYVHGANLDLREFCVTAGARLTDLPGYAFQRQRHWLSGQRTQVADAVASASAPKSVRELLTLVSTLVDGVAVAAGKQAVDPFRSFKDHGLDSLGTLELRRRLATVTGLVLSTALTFDFPTPQRLAEHLHDRLSAGAPPSPVSAIPASTTGSSADGEDPIVIVGMACRFPGGVTSPEDLWRVVVDNVDGTSEFPTNRGWDLDALSAGDGSGTSYVRRGGFLHDADEFDAPFFGISPREALAMDPQQRVALEMAWEAMEMAGIDPARLRGSDTGVFVGLMKSEYGPYLDKPVGGTDGHLVTGAQLSVASGRISYAFGFHGPAVSIDTACSSSLVALHQAVEGLRRGECTLALAGGVTVMARPGTFVEFSRQRGLSPDGRCKPFSAAADGTAFAEGAGMLVVERLSDARRNGHPVVAVVRGTAVNSDGASNGLTAPNGLAQEKVVRRALHVAGLKPADVDVVEAHGTGTQLGDPLEAKALIATYGRDRPADRPLLIGSIKSNIGHTQAASGVAGVIKMVQAMRHGHLPAILHLDELSPHVDWSDGSVVPLDRARPWPAVERPRRAAVSSFGISGTNAHAIIEQPPAFDEQPPEDPADGRLLAWVLSARTEASLRGQAERLHAQLTADAAARPVDVAYSLARTRSRFDHRAVLTGRDRDELLAGLAALRDQGFDAPVTTGKARPGSHTAFLFTGQGGQRVGMGRELYAEFEVFAAAFDEVCAALDEHLDRPLREIMWAEPGTPDAELVNQTSYTQPALFAYQVAAFRLLEALGVAPDVVAGHSVGEIAAAHIAGVWNLADAARMVTARARLMQALPAGGAMVAISASYDEVQASLVGRENLIAVAAVNGPDGVVVSGDEDTCLAVADHWRALNRRTKRLTVSHAFHSPLMEPMIAEFAVVLLGLTFREPSIDHVTDLVGTEVTASWSEPKYWLEQIRRPVLFRSVVAELESRQVTAYLEVGPQAVLAAMTRECLTGDASVSALYRKDRPEADALLAALAESATAGMPVDWAVLASGGRRIDLPTYAFDRQRSWVAAEQAVDVTSAGLRSAGHPMLRALLDLADGDGAVATGSLSLSDLPWLADHRMGGRVIVPGTAVLDLVLEVADQVGCGRIEEMMFESPLVLPAEGDLRLQVVATGDEVKTIQVYSRQDDSEPWIRNASATAGASAPAGEATPGWATSWPPAGAEPVDFDAAYDQLAESGYDYGPSFRAVHAVWHRDEVVFAEIVLPEGLDVAGYGVHPVLLDAALHPYVTGSDSAELRLPFVFQGVTLAATGATALRVRLTPDGPDSLSIEVTDTSGRLVLSVERLRVRAVPAGFAAPAADSGSNLYRVGWEKVPVTRVDTASWAVVGEPIPGVTAYADLDELAAAEPGVAILRCGEGTVRDNVHEVLALVQRWLADDRLAETRLVLVTSGAVSTGLEARTIDPAQAAVWGFVRSAQSENPGRFVLVDLVSDQDADGEAVVLAVATGEPQVAVRDGAPRVPRLTRDAGPDVLVEPETAWVLSATGGGALEDVALVPSQDADRPLEPGFVRVAVRAAGLNFRDVMITLGRMEHSRGLGWEFAGEVREVASDVTQFVPGDRVLSTVSGNGFGSAVTAEACMLAKIPAGWSWVRAASVPLAYLTAYYALVQLAQVKPGESVLIHAAAGGVGMAAVQLAQHLGAEVFGTASAGKWDTLRAMGLDDEHSASSRDVEFEGRVLAATGGRGVDVVLNSLAGEFVDASLRVTADGGRFLEMGKTDIRDADEVAAQYPGVSYRAFDLHEVEPAGRGQLLAEVVRLFGEDELTSLPVTTWDVRRAPTALRYLSQARHVGKVVLTMPRALDPDGTVLITGATGTLGRLVARHLVTGHGARNLLLVGRRGAAAEGMGKLTEELTGLGASVRIAACDVADRAAVARLLAEVAPEHPLTAVVHAAGVLSDGVIGQLTPERVDQVLRPKVDAALILHELTAELDLAQFVLFSSIAGVIGNAGQANYAAANAALDALAELRSRAGLPAVSVAWGLWAAESGMTAALSDTDRARLAGAGTKALSVDEGLALFDAALGGPEPAVVASPLDLTALRARAAGGADIPAPLRGLVRASRRAVTGTAAATEASLATRLAGLTEDAARQVITEAVGKHVIDVLGYGADGAVDTERPFNELGFDSLTSVELRNRLSTMAGLRLPATVVFDFPTAKAMTGHLYERLRDQASEPEPAEVSLDEVERLLREAASRDGSQDGLARILRRMLAELDGSTADRDADVDSEEFSSDEEIFAFFDERA